HRAESAVSPADLARRSAAPAPPAGRHRPVLPRHAAAVLLPVGRVRDVRPGLHQQPQRWSGPQAVRPGYAGAGDGRPAGVPATAQALMPRVYLDTASLSLLIERKTEPETEAVRQLLEAGKSGQIELLHSDVVDSWLWG